MINQPDRLPPQNLDAEQSVLGSMLLDRDAVTRAIEILTPEDFYREQHRAVYQAICRLFDRGEAVDMVTATEELKKSGQLEQVGGVSYIASMANMVPTAAHVERYAKIVAEKSILRRLASTSTEIVHKVYEGREAADDLLDEAEQSIFAIAQGIRRKSYSVLKDVLVRAFERIEYLFANKGRAIGIPTGFSKLDELLCGFQPAELIVLAARPSMGKTTLALNFAAHAAVEHRIPVGVFSLEMSSEQVAQRILCAEARVDSYRLRTGYLRDHDWPELSRALGKLSEAPIFIDDTPNMSLMEMRARARRMRAEHKIGMLIIDYLQLMHARGRAESRQQEISEITRALKGLARELDIPVLALSQLSRAVEQRESRRPQLSDLRESGAIEQDADVVAFIYIRPDQEPERNNHVEVIIAKQRNGPIGTCELIFMKEYARFVEPAVEHAPPDER